MGMAEDRGCNEIILKLAIKNGQHEANADVS